MYIVMTQRGRLQCDGSESHCRRYQSVGARLRFQRSSPPRRFASFHGTLRYSIRLPVALTLHTECFGNFSGTVHLALDVSRVVRSSIGARAPLLPRTRYYYTTLHCTVRAKLEDARSLQETIVETCKMLSRDPILMLSTDPTLHIQRPLDRH